MTILATRLVNRILRAVTGARRGGEPIDVSRQAAARFSRGNVAVQFNAFVAEEAFEKERSEVVAITLPR